MINEQPKIVAPVANDDSHGTPRIDQALYERHLLIDKAVDVVNATPREQFEAFALAVRLLHSYDRIIQRLPRPRWKVSQNAFCHPSSPLFLFCLALRLMR